MCYPEHVVKGQNRDGRRRRKGLGRGERKRRKEKRRGNRQNTVLKKAPPWHDKITDYKINL